VTRIAKEQASSLINDIHDVSFFETSDCHHCCSIAQAGMLILCSIYLKNPLQHPSGSFKDLIYLGFSYIMVKIRDVRRGTQKFMSV
jgi:hypothetical protein